MKNNGILLVGGGGHCKSVIDTLLVSKKYSKIGIVDKNFDNLSFDVMGISVVGCDEDLLELRNKGYDHAFVTIGSVGNPILRINIFNKIVELGYNIPNIIDKSSLVSDNTMLGQGVFIGKNTILNAMTSVGDGVIINSGAIIEHDCIIGDYAHIATGAILCGNVEIGKCTHIGAGTSVKQQISIGKNTVIGMGSVVVSDIESNVMAYGNPCKVVRYI